MRISVNQIGRRGAITVEAGVVYPLLFLLLLFLIVAGIGVFHHQQVTWQAREAARWACVRGSTWEKETDKPAPKKDEIRRDVVLPLAFTMDQANLNVNVEWIDQATGVAQDWDSASKARFSRTAANEYVVNTVRVTVTYDWVPARFLAGPIRLVSVSEYPMGS